MNLTHLDENGAVHMVNVGDKQVTQREATAQAVVTMKRETLQMIVDGAAPKGDVLACARVAGIMAAKRTSDLIPMCHPIPMESVEIAICPISDTQLRIVSTLRCTHKTGIEMEALTAASIAALTIYDMCKAVDRGMRIDQTMLLHKSGGKSGEYRRDEQSGEIQE
ncbi:MAG: cyclic pyranopterin monophosphate synthase MoaC [Butyricicoccus sp.]